MDDTKGISCDVADNRDGAQQPQQTPPSPQQTELVGDALTTADWYAQALSDVISERLPGANDTATTTGRGLVLSPAAAATAVGTGSARRGGVGDARLRGDGGGGAMARDERSGGGGGGGRGSATGGGGRGVAPRCAVIEYATLRRAFQDQGAWELATAAPSSTEKPVAGQESTRASFAQPATAGVTTADSSGPVGAGRERRDALQPLAAVLPRGGGRLQESAVREAVGNWETPHDRHTPDSDDEETDHRGRKDSTRRDQQYSQQQRPKARANGVDRRFGAGAADEHTSLLGGR